MFWGLRPKGPIGPHVRASLFYMPFSTVQMGSTLHPGWFGVSCLQKTKSGERIGGGKRASSVIR